MNCYPRGRSSCGRRVRPATARSGEKDDPESSSMFGVILFTGGPRRARRIVLAFDSASDADAFAVENHYVDYLVAPLSFLAPAGTRRIR